MTSGRPIALLLLAAWLAPAAASAGLALHVALDHHAGGQAPATAAAAWVHGHAHCDGAQDHPHSAALSPLPAWRAGVSPADPPAIRPEPEDSRLAIDAASDPAASPPARSRGPDLLARLSLLRI